MHFTFIVTLASITGTIANIYKKRWCFVIWLFTNTFWCIYDLSLGLYSQAVLFAVYFILAVLGLRNWKRVKHMKKRCKYTGVLCAECEDEDFEICGCDGDCESCNHAEEDEDDE